MSVSMASSPAPATAVSAASPLQPQPGRPGDGKNAGAKAPGAQAAPPAGAPSADAPSSGTQSSNSKTSQQAALRQLVVKYAYDQAHGTDAAALAALRRQIVTDAKALGQQVSLPHAPASAETSAAPAAAPGKVSLFA